MTMFQWHSFELTCTMIDISKTKFTYKSGENYAIEIGLKRGEWSSLQKIVRHQDVGKMSGEILNLL